MDHPRGSFKLRSPHHTRRREQQQQRTKRRPHHVTHVKGVYKGEFYRVPLKSTTTTTTKSNLLTLPQLPPPNLLPQRFKPTKPTGTVKNTTTKTSTTSTTIQSKASNIAASFTVVSTHSRRSVHCVSRVIIFSHSRANCCRCGCRENKESVLAWWKANWAILVLNVGSLCTLVGFTRSDVLELRSLSLTGSVSNVIYGLTVVPRRYLPMAWSSLFATVNATKITQIVRERQGRVVMTPQQQTVYEDYFLPHGLTPKQLELVWDRATLRHAPKGQAILVKDQPLQKIWLVVHGKTRANILGRHLSAVSRKQSDDHNNNKDDDTDDDDDDDDNAPPPQRGKDPQAGAWIGEMTFLELYGQKQKKQSSSSSSSATTTTTSNEEGDTIPSSVTTRLTPRPAVSGDDATAEQQQKKLTKKKKKKKKDEPVVRKSLYTIVAAEDCTVLEWTHQEMEELMNRSTDMRAALTRAMTAAIVGKVINFSISRTSGSILPTWSTWLDDWKHSSPVHQEGEEEGAAGPTTATDNNEEEQTLQPAKEQEE